MWSPIPGIIEGAHQGNGLGIQFLKHIRRTKTLLHLVDCLPLNDKDPLDNVAKVLEELKQFPGLEDKPMVLILNKVDLIAEDDLENLKSRFAKTFDKMDVMAISAHTGKGVVELIERLTEWLVSS